MPTDYTATNGTTVVLGIGLLVNDAVTILNYTSSIAALPTSRNVQDFTATAAQTTFTVTNGYIVGLIDVFVNGSKLTSSEFTATNGTTFVLTVASTVNDQVQSINYTASVNGISGAGTVNELAYFTASATIASLPTATYPSLTELSYVKGVTSAIQTQLNAKAATLSGTTNYHAKFTSSSAIGNSLIYDNGTNVGIGTTTGDEALTIKKPSGTACYVSAYNGTTGILTGVDTAGLPRIFVGSADPISFWTNGSERMRITSGGNVLIGKSNDTTPAETIVGLQITTGARILCTVDSTYSAFSRLNVDGDIITFHRGTTTKVGSISVTTSSTGFNTSSDYRLKEDLKPFNGLEKISSIKVYDYKWKTDGSRMNGVLAHELQEVLPYAVTGTKDGKDMQGVDYSKLVPILIKAIQEQQVQIEELKTLLENK